MEHKPLVGMSLRYVQFMLGGVFVRTPSIIHSDTLILKIRPTLLQPKRSLQFNRVVLMASSSKSLPICISKSSYDLALTVRSVALSQPKSRQSSFLNSLLHPPCESTTDCFELVI